MIRLKKERLNLFHKGVDIIGEQDSLDLFAEQGKYYKGNRLSPSFIMNRILYTVLRIRVEETNEQYEDKEAVITGYFPKIHEHENYIFYGEMKDHPKFGLQFQVLIFGKISRKQSKESLAIFQVNFLKGLGKRQLKKSLKHLERMRFQKF